MQAVVKAGVGLSTLLCMESPGEQEEMQIRFSASGAGTELSAPNKVSGGTRVFVSGWHCQQPGSGGRSEAWLMGPGLRDRMSL